MSEAKTHYRRVLKSNHLGIADLEDLVEAKTPLIFTIKHVNQELNVSVAGRKGDFNIAYFNESIKPLVLNATNAKVVKGFANSPFVEDWQNIPVQLYIDESIMLMGERVGGVRIMPQQPRAQKPVLTPEHKGWEKAIVSYVNNNHLKDVLTHMDVSVENQEKIIEEAQNRMDANND